jgi:lycopene cyclase domain-containing protein
MSRYAAVLITALFLPFLLSFWAPLRFYRNLRSLFISIFCVVIIFGGWDVFATWRGHWYFNPKMVWPTRLINLPIEEWLFFIVIPFCCIFTWEAIKYLKSKVKPF